MVLMFKISMCVPVNVAVWRLSIIYHVYLLIEISMQIEFNKIN